MSGSFSGLAIETIAVLPYAAPVGFAALGEIVGQKSGVINIGLEGMMLMGAYFSMTGVLLGHGHFAIPLGFLLAIVSAVILAEISAYFTVVLAVDQVVVGTAINLLALGVTSTLFRMKYGSSGKLLTLPTLTRFEGVDAGIVLLILCLPVVAWILNKSAWGLTMRSAGEYPKATEAAGFSVVKLRMWSLAIGGIFAGLAGAYLVLGTSGSFTENMTSGRGFVAIALVTFGRWKPTWVFLAAILIGFLETLQFRFQAIGIHVPYELLIASPYAIAIIILLIAGKGTTSPAALGIPFRRTI